MESVMNTQSFSHMQQNPYQLAVLRFHKFAAKED